MKKMYTFRFTTKSIQKCRGDVKHLFRLFLKILRNLCDQRSELETMWAKIILEINTTRFHPNHRLENDVQNDGLFRATEEMIVLIKNSPLNGNHGYEVEGITLILRIVRVLNLKMKNENIHPIENAHSLVYSSNVLLWFIYVMWKIQFNFYLFDSLFFLLSELKHRQWLSSSTIWP